MVHTADKAGPRRPFYASYYPHDSDLLPGVLSSKFINISEFEFFREFCHCPVPVRNSDKGLRVRPASS